MRGGETLEDAKMLDSRWWALGNPHIGLQCNIPKLIFLPQFKTCYFLLCLLARKALEDKLDDTAAISDERAPRRRRKEKTTSLARRPLHQDAGGGGRDKSARKAICHHRTLQQRFFPPLAKKGGAVSSRKENFLSSFLHDIDLPALCRKGKGEEEILFRLPFSPPPKKCTAIFWVSSQSFLPFPSSSAQRLLKFIAPFHPQFPYFFPRFFLCNDGREKPRSGFRRQIVYSAVNSVREIVVRHTKTTALLPARVLANMCTKKRTGLIFCVTFKKHFEW